jgi:DNA invertase Pin-like site-specific DNA recombinase
MTTQRAVAYVRVSSEMQLEGHSLDAQRAEIARYCERERHTLLRTYADEGVSAHTDDIAHRPQLAALLEDARGGGFDVVVVHTIDRWARNVGVQRQALQLLGTAGVGFASVIESIDFTTPAGKLMLTMIGGVSEFFSDQLAVHVAKAQRQRAELGLPPGPVPFGYTVDEPGTTPRIDPAAGPALIEAFESRAAGESHASIAAWLNARGLTTRRGNRFTGFAVRDFFRTRFYLGVVSYDGAEYPGQHERLIDDQLWERVQRRLNRRAPARRDRRRLLLQGRARCCRCRHPLYPDRTSGERPIYRERHRGDCPTNGRSAWASEVDAQIGSLVAAIQIPSSDAIRAAALHRPPLDTRALEDRRRRLGRAYAETGAYSEADYRARLESAVRDAATHEADDQATLALISDLGTLWHEATANERARLVGELFEAAYVDLETDVLAAVTPHPAVRGHLERAVRALDRGGAIQILDAAEALDAA